MNQNQKLLLQLKRKRIKGIEQKPHWRRPNETGKEFTNAKPLQQLALTSVQIVYP